MNKIELIKNLELLPEQLVEDLGKSRLEAIGKEYHYIKEFGKSYGKNTINKLINLIQELGEEDETDTREHLE